MGLMLLGFLLVLVDQASKWAVRTFLGPDGILTVIPDFFFLTYVENRGAAWGLWQDSLLGSWILKILSLLATLLLMVLWVRLHHKGLCFFLTLLIAGSLGNLIDRFFLGFVTDFLTFRFGSYWFPSFNIADSAIVIGTLGFVALLLFHDSAWQDFSYALPGHKKDQVK